ncbi:MAG: hypothetical protein IRZ00_06575 [Gemmatimonadetes bacterium]|nr:hypothetical protein [Gemmatimonadota bacterium]
MNAQIRRTLAAALLLTAANALAGCGDDFFSVTDPDVLQANKIDPKADAEVLARSAFQNLAQAYGDLAVYTGWWSHEARVGDTFPTRNEFGRRFIDDANGTLRDEVWSPLARAASTGEQAVQTFKNANTSGLPLALAAFTAGYSMELMAETFCEGTVSSEVGVPGPHLNTQQMLDLAIERFQLARDEAGKLTSTEAKDLATAATVGLARAYLFAGKKSEAASTAAQVPASFEFDLTYVDDPANRTRLGNTVWSFSSSRQSLVVPPQYIQVADAGDPRITYFDTNRLAQDSELRFIRQQKFPAWNAPMRLASGLEARYIAAEASGDVAAQVALINERRAVGKQPPFTSSDPQAVLAELMMQKALDFWLEVKKMGDFRRNGHAVPWVLEDGQEYYKAGVDRVGTQKCFPVPQQERLNNPNW